MSRTKNLTLKEAADSGRPYKHRRWSNWYTREESFDVDHTVTVADAIASDWEIQQKESYSRQDVERAVKMAIKLESLCKTDEHIMEEALAAADGEGE